MINLDGMTDDEKMAALESIHQSIADSKEVQKQKITSNVEMIVKALKKIESDIKQRYDQTGALIESIKNGADGRDGIDGKNGKDGRNGKDGPAGPRGFDGAPGRDGANGQDGISVVDAQVHFDGGLTFTLSNGQIINAGEIVNPDTAENIKVITNGGGTSQTVLDTLASLQAQISAIVSGLSYKGTWNASTNTPTLTSSVGTAGFYYIVSVAGSTNLNGITDWQVGDWAVFSGSVWQKLDQTNLVTSVAGRTGAVTLSTGDISGLGTIATQASSNVTITGGSITGITDLAIADGGTGQSTAAAAITALTGTQTSGYYLRSNGTNASLSAIQAADVPTLNQNTTGSAASLSATNPVSRGGTNLTTLTNKGVLYASSTSQVATGTALQFDGTNFGMGATPSSWGSTYRAIEIGAQTALSYESNGSIKSTSLATNSYNATNTGARPYYKENGLATQYQQNVGEHAWYTAPTGIAGSSTTITTGKIYTNLTAGNQADFGAVNGLVGTIWTATSSGTLTSGTVVQNIDFVESMRIDAYGYVKIGSLIASKAVFTDSSKNLVSTGTVGIDQGGTGATTAANARTNLGATTVGSNVFTLTNPSAITFPRFNADNTVSALDAATFRTAIGAGTSSTSGTVTSVAITVPSILSVSGSPITSSGTFAISLSGTALPVGNGGTGQTTSIAALNALLPTQTGNANKYLQTDGTNASWDAVSLSTSDISGTLGTTNGGTNLTSFTSGGVVYASSSSALATGSALTFDGTNLGVGTASPSEKVGINQGNIYALRTGGAKLRLADQNNECSVESSPTSGDSQLVFKSNATEGMRLTSTGLGIGTSSPVSKLQVNPSGAYGIGTVSNAGLHISPSNITGGFATGSVIWSNYALGGSTIQSYISAATYGANYMDFSANGSATQMRLDNSGNLGLGVTPSAWSLSGLQALQVKNGSLYGYVNEVGMQANCYYNSGWKYIATAAASQYVQVSGAHQWYNAPSGTAGNAITFTQAMTLDASGRLGVGTTSPAYTLDAYLTDTSGTRTTPVDVAAITAYTTSNPYNGYGAGLVFKHTNYTYVTPRVAARIRSVVNDNSVDSFGGSLAFDVTATNNGSLTQAMVLNYAGNLGLGVTPSAWTTAFKAFQVGATGSLVYNGSTDVYLSNNYANIGGASKYITTAAATLYQQGSGVHAWYNAPSGTAGNAVSFTQAMTLDASGNLLVGTTSTGLGKLNVNGTISTANDSGGTFALAYNAHVDSRSWRMAHDVIAYGDFAIQQSTTQTGATFASKLLIDSSGNLGIGRTDPSYLLDLKTTSTSVTTNLKVDSAAASGNYAEIAFQLWSGAGGGLNTFGGSGTSRPSVVLRGLSEDGSAKGAFVVATFSGGSTNATLTEKMRVDSSGNLLVGTTNTTPASSNVVGFAVNNSGYISLTGNATSAIDCNRTNDGIIQAFRQGGTLVGSVSVTTLLTSYNTTSDYRLKTVIGPVANAGQRIDALQPVEYTWNSNGSRTRGFLAHQFQEVYAGSVTGTKDAVDAEGNPEYQAMQAGSSEVIADLVAEIQSLRKRLADAGI